MLVNAFILACVPLLEKDPTLKIRYESILNVRLLKESNHTFLKYIPDLKKKIEAETILCMKEIKIAKKESATKERLNRIKALEESISTNINQIKTIRSIFSSVNAIRDRYFDKNGYLNVNKKRVQQLINRDLLHKIQNANTRLQEKTKKKIKPKKHGKF